MNLEDILYMVKVSDKKYVNLDTVSVEIAVIVNMKRPVTQRR